ncbi:hypothetical protein Corgl_0465 [Coriobacterium glomerans PW2]|uniref:Uncharacterized protein n=1 Tax=Coriobacterium glomerans (strain ATCC 49209 / DSM 20642 / JCM 10262 / PW2) TaxID=700015 RepID=F2N7A8_CORGP|nr:leucine-rich repeat domain-containing protein [Coriobacterium glomerans]AEB06583.1 hypothetical protein Corgl_0465 [Coriobacterium glomerans PW2]
MHRSARYIAHRIVAPLACALLFLLILIVPNVWADSSSAAKADQISRGEEATVDPHHDGDKKSGDADKTDKSHEGKKTDEDKKADKGNNKGEKADKDKKADKSDKDKKADKSDKSKKADEDKKADKTDGDTSVAPAPDPRDPAQRDTSGSGGVNDREKKDFTSYITIGDKQVECAFQETIDKDEDGKITADHVAVCSGKGGIAAINTALSGDVFIPKTVTAIEDGTSYTVDTIGNYAFYKCTRITSTGLLSFKSKSLEGATIRSIGSNAYCGCQNLRSTDLKDSGVEELGEYAFGNSGVTATGLADNETIKTLPGYAFYGCGSLESTDLETSKVTKIVGWYTFASCPRLKDTGLAGNTCLESIEQGCFSSCIALTETGLAKTGNGREGNNKLTLLPKQVFDNCPKLTSTGLAGNTAIETIGDDAFASCYQYDKATGAEIGLKKTGLENNSKVTKIGADAFLFDKLLESTGLENTSSEEEGTGCKVRWVGDYAFQGCSALRSTGLAKNRTVETLGKYAFAQTGVTSTGLGQNPYDPDDPKDYRHITELEKAVFSGCGSLTDTGLATNTHIKTIGESAFAGCYSTNLKTSTGLATTGLATNHTVETIGKQAFLGDVLLGTVNKDDKNENPGDLVLNGCEGRLSIGEQAFSGAPKYTSVYILCEKENLKIGKRAFDYDIDSRKTSQSYIPNLYVSASWKDTTNYSFGEGQDKSSYSVDAYAGFPRLTIMNPLYGMHAVRISKTSDVELSYSYNLNSNVSVSYRDAGNAVVVDSFNVKLDPKKNRGSGKHTIVYDSSSKTNLPFGATTIVVTLTLPNDGHITYPAGAKSHSYNGDTAGSHERDLDPVTFEINFDGNGGKTDDGKKADSVTKTEVPYGNRKIDDVLGVEFKRGDDEFLDWIETAGQSENRLWPAQAEVAGMCNIQDGSVTLKARWKSESAVGLRVLSKKKTDDPLGKVSYVISNSSDERDAPTGLDDLYTDDKEINRVTWPLVSDEESGLTPTVYWLDPKADGPKTEDESRTYYLHVASVPAGYDAPSEATKIVVSSNGVKVNDEDATITDDRILDLSISYGKAPNLPGTGWFTGAATLALAEAGASIAVLSIFAVTMWLMRRNSTC